MAGSGGRLEVVGDAGGEEGTNPEAQAQKSPNLNSGKTTPPPKSAQASSCWLLPPAFSSRVFSAFQFPESRPSAEHRAGRNGGKTGVLFVDRRPGFCRA